MLQNSDLIKEIKDRNEIVSTISEYVKVRTRKDKYLAECIFSGSTEKILIIIDYPSQTYFNLKNNTGGDVIDFVSKYKGISLYESISELATKANLDIVDFDIENRLDEKNKILHMNKDAANFYQKMLYSKQGEEALGYLTQRSLAEKTISDFKLGYAPKKWDSLLKHFKSLGYTKDEMIKSGLFSIDNKGQLRDKFINRVMFPIQNAEEDIVAFGGRVMDDSKPKYLNSPETAAFIKSENIYGWNLIKDANKDSLIICEGYMDVISMHQAGFKQACASLGTAFTEEQADILKKNADTILLAYDNDEAGIKATQKNLQTLSQVGLNGKIINLEPYKDPDEFIKRLGKNKFQERINNAKEGYIVILEKFKDSPQILKQVAADMIMNESSNKRDLLIDRICQEFALSKKEIKKEIANIASSIIRPDTITGSLDDILARLKENKPHKNQKESFHER